MWLPHEFLAQNVLMKVPQLANEKLILIIQKKGDRRTFSMSVFSWKLFTIYIFHEKIFNVCIFHESIFNICIFQCQYFIRFSMSVFSSHSFRMRRLSPHTSLTREIFMMLITSAEIISSHLKICDKLIIPTFWHHLYFMRTTLMCAFCSAFRTLHVCRSIITVPGAECQDGVTKVPRCRWTMHGILLSYVWS